jgi:predicted ArsR family transcriptional regulator
MARKVQGDEILWAIRAFGPVTTRELADVLPISYPAVLHRCRQFTSQGYLESNEETKPYTWEISVAGEDRLADAYVDLPPAEPASVRKYFEETESERSYRSMSEEVMLATVAGLDGEWHSTGVITGEVDVVRQTVRTYLHQLVERDWVEVDTSGSGYEWRVTEAGREQLEEAEGEVVVEDGSYGIVSPVSMVEAVADLEGEWQTTTAVVDDVAVGRDTVLRRLHECASRGWVVLDESARPYRWRVTDLGQEQLSPSKESVADRDA